MIVGTVEVKLHAPYVHSLKEKRMIVKSIIGKLKNRFNISICETGEQDIHQIIVIGAAAIADHTAACDSIIDHILDFIDMNYEVEVLDVVREIK